jgi:hypothetical protein
MVAGSLVQQELTFSGIPHLGDVQWQALPTE